MEAAMQIGFPVALNAYGPDLIHRTDVNGVRLSLHDEYDVLVAYEQLAATLGRRMTGAVVQAMAAPGVEMMIGATLDPVFGPVLAAGSGGALVELLHDVAFRLAPLTTTDPEAMLAELRSAKLLHGFRGSKPADIAAFADAILRVSVLMELCPEIRELDINPIIVTETGVTAVDVRVRVHAACPPSPSRRVSY
jgi:acyl-CoA synthetase (NDP forming)